MNFNKSQTSAIQHKDGAMLVLAGPGSGKTAVIINRTQNLIEEYNVSPKEILVITFTKAAAMEMKERFCSLVGDSNLGVNFGTFHAVFFMILKHAYKFNSSNIVSDDVRYQMMREIISRQHLDYKDENEFISDIFSEIGKVKNSRIDINNFYSNSCGAEVFRKIYTDYNNRLKNSRLIDYDDMLLYTYELFSERKDILKAWQNKYKYILIDEFQDINRLQYEIIKMMARPLNNLFIVGDDDQSIYRFRGANPDIMQSFVKDFPDAKQVVLDRNYRCGKYIVETSQNLISHNTKRFKKNIIADRDSDNSVKYITFENRKDENLYIIKQIEELLKTGKKTSDIAILFRTNMQPRALLEQLMSYNVPFKIKDRIPNLYEHWIYKDLMAYIRISRGSKNRADFISIMNRPKRYISRDSLWDEEVSYEEWMKAYDEQPWIAERIEKLQADMKLISKMNPYAAINYIRRGIGYDDFLEEYAEYKDINKEELIEILDEIQFSAKGFKTLEKWQEHIVEYTKRLKILADKKEDNVDAITLATLHSSKGLEFDTVFILDANEGIMPYKKALMDHEIEEERRLFYVGMTRAKNNLFICSVKSIRDKESNISRFVGESKKSSN